MFNASTESKGQEGILGAEKSRKNTLMEVHTCTVVCYRVWS